MSRYNNGELWWKEFQENYPEGSKALLERFKDSKWFAKIIGQPRSLTE